MGMNKENVGGWRTAEQMKEEIEEMDINREGED